MKKEIAEKWVEALRSNKYRQAQNYLKSKDGYCCLGVLCEISNLAKFELIEEQYYYLGNNETLPIEVREWSGILTPEGHLIDGGPPLAVLNDVGYSFDQIATIIEHKWEEL